MTTACVLTKLKSFIKIHFNQHRKADNSGVFTDIDIKLVHIFFLVDSNKILKLCTKQIRFSDCVGKKMTKISKELKAEVTFIFLNPLRFYYVLFFTENKLLIYIYL